MTGLSGRSTLVCVSLLVGTFDPAFSQARIRGRVVDSAGSGIPDVVLSVGGGRSALTNAAGLFELPAPGPLPWTLRALKVGFTPLAVIIRGPIAVDWDSTMTMMQAAIRIEDLNTTAPRNDVAERRLSDFHFRRRVGSGTYLTEEDIRKRSGTRTAELLQGIPGVRVSYNPPGVPGGTGIRFSRCQERIGVWIDGFKQRPDTFYRRGDLFERVKVVSGMVADMLDRVAPQQIAGMEIYRGVSQIPAEFREDSCAAIVVWTK